MRFRQVYLLILVALTVVVVVSATSGKVGPFRWKVDITSESGNMSASLEYYPSAESSASISRPSEGLSVFLLSNQMGSVKVRGVDSDQIEISYTIKVYAETQEQADEYLDSCSISADKQDDRLSVRLIRPVPTTHEIKGVVVDYDVSVPHGIELDIDNRFGTADVSHYNGDVTLDNQFGATTVNDIVGDVVVQAGYGRFSVTDITGNAVVQSSFASRMSDIADVDGAVTLQLQYGDDVELRNVTKPVNVSAGFSKLALANVDGSAQIDSQYSNITASNIKGPIKVTSRFDTIRLSRVVNPVHLKARYANVHIGLVDEHEATGGFSFDLRVRYGNIKSGIPLEEDKVSSTETLASGKYGLGAIPITAETHYTDIRLTLDD
ncbi:MAG: hypothetical protein ACOYET_06955 [Bacillota bacterium]|jgi:DUF4097 and DUF4098 domain-containing protein YvlB